jgi:hypothetical protein
MLGQAKHPRVILALCVFTVFAIAAVGIIDYSYGTAGAASPDPTSQIQDEYWSHLQSIRSMNASAIEQAYASNASVQFSVPGEESTGNHTGLRNIGILFGADMFPNFAVPNFSKMNSTTMVAGNTATLDSTFVINGYNSNASPQSALVSLHARYIKMGGDWLISFESWNFTFRS